jgi:pimeloyl-ACP methyl ester carboxylesterase
LRAAGFGAAEIEEASSLRWALWEYYRDAGAANDILAERRAELERRVEEARGQAWFQEWSMRVAPLDADTYRNWASDVWLDPRPALRAINVPILATYAADDENVPTADSVRILEAIRAERGGVIDIVVYPGRTHSMFKWRDILNGGYPPDYFSNLSGWVSEHSQGTS